MYLRVKAEENIRIPPNLFVMDRDNAIKEVLKKKYEGTIQKDLGFIVEVVDAKAKGTGVVIPGDPYIYYKTEFEMITFTVEPNEVFRGVVKDVLEFGAFVVIGPFEALLHNSQIAKERFFYDRKNKVLHNLNKDKTLKKGDVVLAKVSTVSMKGSSADVKISLTMRPEGLGKVDWLVEEKKQKGSSKKKSKKSKK